MCRHAQSISVNLMKTIENKHPWWMEKLGGIPSRAPKASASKARWRFAEMDPHDSESRFPVSKKEKVLNSVKNSVKYNWIQYNLIHLSLCHVPNVCQLCFNWFGIEFCLPNNWNASKSRPCSSWSGINLWYDKQTNLSGNLALRYSYFLATWVASCTACGVRCIVWLICWTVRAVTFDWRWQCLTICDDASTVTLILVHELQTNEPGPP